MKHLKFVWYFIGLVTVIYVATLLFIRFNSPSNTQREIYTSWRESYVIHQTKQQAFVNTSNNKAKPIALSEGQGYGLYLTAKAGANGWAKEKDYDTLLSYYLAHRENLGAKHNKQTYLMQWRQYEKNGKWTSNSHSATDGDLFIANSLVQAEKVWPRHSKYYRQIEHKLTHDILTYEYNPKTKTLTVGDWVKKQSRYYNLMRTSDVAPEFFATFYKTSHDQRWLKVKNNMLDRMVDLSKKHHSGLVPDFAWVTPNNARPVKGEVISTRYDGDYSSNACRVPMMLALSNDARAKKITKKMITFFNKQNQITAGYSLAGNPLNEYQSNSFKAPLFFAIKQNRTSKNDGLYSNLQGIFSKPLQSHNYYDATLTTMAAMEGIN